MGPQLFTAASLSPFISQLRTILQFLNKPNGFPKPFHFSILFTHNGSSFTCHIERRAFPRRLLLRSFPFLPPSGLHQKRGNLCTRRFTREDSGTGRAVDQENARLHQEDSYLSRTCISSLGFSSTTQTGWAQNCNMRPLRQNSLRQGWGWAVPSKLRDGIRNPSWSGAVGRITSRKNLLRMQTVPKF